VLNVFAFCLDSCIVNKGEKFAHVLGTWECLEGVPSSVLRSWLCGSTKEPNGFLVNHRKPRELGVASANHHSWLSSHVVPARPWFWGSTKKPLSITHHIRKRPSTSPRTTHGPQIYRYSRIHGRGQCLEDMFIPHVLGFLPSPCIDECVVSRGCSQLDERGSIYLVDPIAIIEVRGEEVLASTIDSSRLWRRDPGGPGGSKLC
jgi:hypothetical protein